MRGARWLAAIRPAEDRLGAAQRLIGGDGAAEHGAARGRGRDRRAGKAPREARRRSLRLYVEGRAGLQGRLVSATRGGGLHDLPAAFRHEVAETSRLALTDALHLLAYKGEREMAAKALQLIDDRAYDAAAVVPLDSTSMYALNSTRRSWPTSSAAVGRRPPSAWATSRRSTRSDGRGDLVGTRFGPREKVFDAVIDKVEVKAP